MDNLFATLKALVTGSLQAAGDLAEKTADVATDAAGQAVALWGGLYNYYLSQGLSPEDAADKAEIKAREILFG